MSPRFHIPQGEERPFWLQAQMRTASINHGPGTPASRLLAATAWLCRWAKGASAVYFSLSHPLFQKGFLRGSCGLVLYEVQLRSVVKQKI